MIWGFPPPQIIRKVWLTVGKDSKLEVPASTQFVEKGSSFEVDEKGKGERESYDNAMRTKRGGDESL